MTSIRKILLVGYGSIGSRHLENIWLIVPTAELMVLQSRNNVTPIENCIVVNSLDEALQFEPDLALVCNPSSRHISVALKLAEIGVHLFIEKPLSHNLKGVDELLSIIDRSRSKAMVAYNLRFCESLLRFKATLDSGQFGKVLFFNSEVGQYLPDWRADVDYRNSVSSRSELGGGALLELSHELDYLLWFFGQPESVFASLHKVSGLDIDVEDLALIQLNFQNRGQIFCGSLCLDFLQRKPSRKCKIVCEDATIVWDAIAETVEVLGAGPVNLVYRGGQDIKSSYELELRAFLDCIERNVDSPIPLEQGAMVLRLVEKIRLSSNSGQTVVF